jgi:exopolysaccharide biosynthesis polyprenyl glycosylphosphotransferase
VLLEHGTGIAVPEQRSAPLTVAGAQRTGLIRRAPRPDWVGTYRAVLMALEVLAAAATAVVVLTVHDKPIPVALTWAAWLLVPVWPALLGGVGGHSERVFGTGSEEYRRVVRAGMLLLAAVGFLSYAAAIDLSRSFVTFAVPGLAVGTVLLRYAARKGLVALRKNGRCTKRVVVVGRGGAALDLAAGLDRAAYAGLQVVAVCVTPGDRQTVRNATTLPVGGLDEVVAVASRHRADAIAVTSASETAAEYLRRLSWQLEGTGMELLVAPGLIEVAGPRLHIRPLEGLPLLTVEAPRFEGWRRVVKEGLDRLIAVLAIVLLAPVLLTIAVAVKVTSDGPVFYHQERVGVHGRAFKMIKFRSMVVDADRRLATLQDANISDGLLFKMRDDPRVTRVGKILRRLSLDELPQLFNVLGGTMSLVGPRPPLPSEVAGYDQSVRRRLLVKPGLTGLWQISGRSDLPWEEAVRLDLRYVENWSLSLDMLILWKTGRAVLSRSGAY